MFIFSPKTQLAFEHLKAKNQMNWDSIKLRPDGNLVIVPIKGEEISEYDRVLNAEQVQIDEEMPWPLREICVFLQEAREQGIPREGVGALQRHDGKWTAIAVYLAAKSIELRPRPTYRSFNHIYPRPRWTIDPGIIVRWPEESMGQSWFIRTFEPVVKLPMVGLSEHERVHRKSFELKHAMAKLENGSTLNYYQSGCGENWFEPTQDGLWEFIKLEPWEGVTEIDMYYESPRLEHIPWEQWKRIMQSAARRRGLDVEELGVVNRTCAAATIRKTNVPELGTRPIYFYRKPNAKAATPREFWGFYTFNKDPSGPTGLSIRPSPPHGYGCIVSDSLLGDAPGSPYRCIDLDVSIYVVNYSDDWDVQIHQDVELGRLSPEPDAVEVEMTWLSDEEDGLTTDEDQGEEEDD